MFTKHDEHLRKELDKRIMRGAKQLGDISLSRKAISTRAIQLHDEVNEKIRKLHEYLSKHGGTTKQKNEYMELLEERQILAQLLDPTE